MTTPPGATEVSVGIWRNVIEFATAVVESPTIPQQLEASQNLLDQAGFLRRQLVLAATNRGMSLADVGKALNMSPEGARKLRLTAARELER